MKVWQRQFKEFMQYVPREDREEWPWQAVGSPPATGWATWTATDLPDHEWSVIQVLGIFHYLKFNKGTGIWYAINHEVS